MNEIRKILENSIEDTDTPNMVLNFLKEFEGQKITKRHVSKMKQELSEDNICLNKAWGGTDLHFGEFEIRLPSDSMIDTEWIKEHNKNIFEAAEERNKKILELLQKNDRQEALEESIAMYKKASSELLNMLMEFQVVSGNVANSYKIDISELHKIVERG
jgi:hypothetical protein